MKERTFMANCLPNCFVGAALIYLLKVSRLLSLVGVYGIWAEKSLLWYGYNLKHPKTVTFIHPGDGISHMTDIKCFYGIRKRGGCHQAITHGSITCAICASSLRVCLLHNRTGRSDDIRCCCCCCCWHLRHVDHMHINMPDANYLGNAARSEKQLPTYLWYSQAHNSGPKTEQSASLFSINCIQNGQWRAILAAANKNYSAQWRTTGKKRVRHIWAWVG